MPKCIMDPVTAEPALTHREKLLIGAYIANGGNGQQAAIAADYSTVRALSVRLSSAPARGRSAAYSRPHR